MHIPPPEPSKVRRLLRVVAAAAALALLVVSLGMGWIVHTWATADIDTRGQVAFANAVAVPPLAPSTVGADGVRQFDLVMREGAADLGRGPGTRTWGVNGDYLGPTVRAQRGEEVRVNVTNMLGEVSTLHWHGMHLPAAMDGGPHQVVEPGVTWSPQWTVNQPAATLWYHPHLHGSTAEHVYRGVAGMFLVDDPDGPALPAAYGVDDVPVIVQDKRFDGDQLRLDGGLLNSVGVLGADVLVNGTPSPYLDVTTERVRLRLLNASNARVYNFAFDTGMAFTLVGTDGGLVPAPVRLTSVQLTPGERAEIVVEVPQGTRAVLQSHPQELGLDRWQSRFSGGGDFLDIMELRAAATLDPSPALPQVLVPARDLGEPTVVRQFELDGSNRINGSMMDMGRIDEQVTVGTTELWEVTNEGGQLHNFHVHDVQFQVLGDEGLDGTADPTLAGPKDTVVVPPGRTVRLLMRFEHYSDPAVPYMYHCHILRHEDQGMMGQFVVLEPGQAAGVVDHSGHP